MEIGKINIPSGGGREDSRVERSKAKDVAMSADGQSPVQDARFLSDSDSVSISGDARVRNQDVEALVSRLHGSENQNDEARAERVEQAKQRLESGELNSADVLKETAVRVLGSLVQLR